MPPRQGQGWGRRGALALGVALLAGLLAPDESRSVAWAKAPKAVGKHAAKSAPKSHETPAPALADKPPTPHGKIAVFSFAGEAAASLRREVVRVLTAKGLKIVANIRPVDSPAQFREMADALHVFAYVDGELESDGPQASATVQVRSGVTGLKIASVTFAGERKKVMTDLSHGLWDALAPALGRASAEALLPHAHQAPMRIEAGTPIGAEDEAPPVGGGPGPS